MNYVKGNLSLGGFLLTLIFLHRRLSGIDEAKLSDPDIQSVLIQKRGKGFNSNNYMKVVCERFFSKDHNSLPIFFVYFLSHDMNLGHASGNSATT